jgi:predicted dehydrogenase
MRSSSTCTPNVADDVFAKEEGVFGRRLIAGAMVFSLGLGLMAHNCVHTFSYGYDKLRFIKPVFIGDTIYTIRTNLERWPKYPELGHGASLLRSLQHAWRLGLILRTSADGEVSRPIAIHRENRNEIISGVRRIYAAEPHCWGMPMTEEVKMSAAFPRLDYQPQMPCSLDHGIAIVGAGGIVNYAHLPAYKKAGFKIIGITDRNREQAERTAREHAIPKVYGDLQELLGDPNVQIVDVAVYPAEQMEIVKQAASAGKHLLCQKPFANDYTKAVRSVEIARAANVKIAVNQQMRWDAGIRCARLLIDDGWLGIPTYATIQVHCKTDWSAWPWIYRGRQLEIMFHSIHYIDSLRYLLGVPAHVFTSGTRAPGEQTEAETKTVSVWEYASGLQVLIDACHSTWQDDAFAIFRLEGTEGVIKGTIGLMYNYPQGRPDTLEFMSRRNSGHWFSPRLDSMWIPDAFVGPMASLMCAIESNSEPETSGRDNLRTLQIVFAEYRSMAERRAVRPEEITG